tara:strand:+ start:714 stop:872 length:159 start_codon:yes stop_codon:yes gene_type:complete
MQAEILTISIARRLHKSFFASGETGTIVTSRTDVSLRRRRGVDKMDSIATED